MIIRPDRLTTPSASDCGSQWASSLFLLPELERRLREALPPSGPLREAGRHHLEAGGKRLRARIVLALGESLGAVPDELMPAAAAVELLHNASLVHDDLQDADPHRRGAETVWSRYGVDSALLLGDCLIASAFAELARSPSTRLQELVPAMARCVGDLASGQLDDTSCATDASCTPDACEELARRKTGRLLALSGDLAVRLAGGDADLCHAVGAALEWIGVAHQIADDLADLAGRKGRARGSDLRAGRRSAALIQRLRLGGGPDAQRVAELLRGDVRWDERRDDGLADRLLHSSAVPACLLQLRQALRQAAWEVRHAPAAVRATLAELGEETADAAFEVVPESARRRCAETSPQFRGGDERRAGRVLASAGG